MARSRGIVQKPKPLTAEEQAFVEQGGSGPAPDNSTSTARPEQADSKKDGKISQTIHFPAPLAERMERFRGRAGMKRSPLVIAALDEYLTNRGY